MDEFIDYVLLFGLAGLVVWLATRPTSAAEASTVTLTPSQQLDAISNILNGTTDAAPVADLSAVPSAPASASNPMTAIQKWAQAIANFESGGNPNALDYRNNNPGNLRVNGASGELGVDSHGFAVFDSLANGWAALINDLTAKVSKYPDYTITQIMTRYLGGDPSDPQVTNQGDPFKYADAVASAVGVTPDTTLQQAFGAGA